MDGFGFPPRARIAAYRRIGTISPAREEKGNKLSNTPNIQVILGSARFLIFTLLLTSTAFECDCHEQTHRNRLAAQDGRLVLPAPKCFHRCLREDWLSGHRLQNISFHPYAPSEPIPVHSLR